MAVRFGCQKVKNTMKTTIDEATCLFMFNIKEQVVVDFFLEFVCRYFFLSFGLNHFGFIHFANFQTKKMCLNSIPLINATAEAKLKFIALFPFLSIIFGKITSF